MQCGGYVRYARAQSAPPQITPPGPVDASSAPVQVVHTDDAGTKLSNLVRRRCFNCCTTETSTWRRSNLSSGKVLCNKCGLFERTHSRARPEQFPLKRRPPAPSTVQLRSPHGATESQVCRFSALFPFRSLRPRHLSRYRYRPCALI
ncbi:hypothetical protein DFH06DRAFT_1004045 [Mycena polygramma]|nr:hypothetical protein DFH06DRAFT_1004045 [Mycena polygramma]